MERRAFLAGAAAFLTAPLAAAGAAAGYAGDRFPQQPVIG